MTKSTQLRLLGSFEIDAGGSTPAVPSPGTQRLVVLLAMRDRVISRSAVAGTLWPDATTELAAVRLRAALARLDPAARSAVALAPGGLRLDPACAVDYRDARAYAENVLEPSHPSPRESAAETRASIAVLCLELLPDHYDDWVLAEAEDWRLLRAAAL